MLRAAVIGLGNVGKYHIRGFLHSPCCKLVALCDVDESVCKLVARDYPDLIVTQNPDEILENPEIDVVSIASYDDVHYSQTVKALKNGKHAFVEKPLCLSIDEAREIRRILNEKQFLHLSSNFILRKCLRFINLYNQIIEGRLGNIYFIEGDYNYGRFSKIVDGWRGQLNYYSVVLGGAIHMIDLILWFVDSKVTEVVAYGNAICSHGTNFKYNDCVVALLKFENGVIGKVTANFGCVYPHYHILNVYGTKTTFCNSFDKALFFYDRNPQKKPIEILDEYPIEDKSELLLDFISAIEEKRTPTISKECVFKTMSVCFAIEESLKKGNPVKVVYI